MKTLEKGDLRLLDARLEVKHLRLIDAIHSEGSLSAAANTLHLTQSALSHQLKNLEEYCGQPLFVRHGKRMLLTAAGERLLHTSRSVLADLVNLSRDLRAIASGEEGRIRLSTECYTSYIWLPQVLPAFQAQYPNVRLDIVPAISEHILEDLSSGQIDLAIMMSGAPDPYYAHPLFDDELVVLTHPSHPFVNQASVSAEELLKETLIVCPIAKPRLFKGLFYKMSERPKQVIDMPLTEAIFGWCAANLGVCVMARWAAIEFLERGELVATSLSMPWMKRTWHAVTLLEELPSYTSAFIKNLKEVKLDSEKV